MSLRALSQPASWSLKQAVVACVLRFTATYHARVQQIIVKESSMPSCMRCKKQRPSRYLLPILEGCPPFVRLSLNAILTPNTYLSCTREPIQQRFRFTIFCLQEAPPVTLPPPNFGR